MTKDDIRKGQTACRYNPVYLSAKAKRNVSRAVLAGYE